ncbi:MAG: hypothetical protein WC644_10865 [Ignavibacteria bacterium]
MIKKGKTARRMFALPYPSPEGDGNEGKNGKKDGYDVANMACFTLQILNT